MTKRLIEEWLPIAEIGDRERAGAHANDALPAALTTCMCGGRGGRWWPPGRRCWPPSAG